MRNLKAKHGLTYLHAIEYLLLCNGNLLCKELQVGQLLVGQVEKIVHFALWYNQYMSAYHWVNVKECKAILALSYLVARYFTVDYSAENCHGAVLKGNLKNFKTNLSARNGNLNNLAYLVAKQSLRNRSIA